ncbi:hypothetical protein K503DRAFT_165697 [Rhizopogon vinicolor AM-OR11-026]|uniref:Uncharacterized protein n=1 Tax=Rhizopogon vinicolor AM-OR11-026 TaxID=1314800 RepID=A0A1B7N0H2_9AGAM|nr:hypothetical protein K503DRAFT_165697 [Rhizopogon vinicolor AM-OR11-026]
MLIFPNTPAVLQDRRSVKIEGHDLWVPDVRNSLSVCKHRGFINDQNTWQGVRVFVVSGTLDIPKLETALSRVIALWPHTAGRLQECNGTWKEPRSIIIALSSLT